MKHFLSVAAALLATGIAQAQPGVLAGANFMTIATGADDGLHRATAHARAGYQVGVFYQHRLNDRWAVVPALQLSHQRLDLVAETYGIADGGSQASYRLGLTYLTLPVRLRATLGKFYLEAGPQLGILFSARETGTEYIGTIAGSYQRDFDRRTTDSYRRFDAGASAGAGLRLPAGFGLAVHAYAGLLSITHVPQSTTYAGALYNRGVQAALSYQLPARR
ncbi:porin family protein [Hymenobacter daeguensis]